MPVAVVAALYEWSQPAALTRTEADLLSSATSSKKQLDTYLFGRSGQQQHRCVVASNLS